MSLQDIYKKNKDTNSRFNQHMELLRDLCNGLDTVVELGAGSGDSTAAIASSTCKTFHTYDLKFKPQISRIKDERKKGMSLHECDVLNASVAKCDLLFIDTLHTYKQLSKELELHADKSRKYIVIHDTVTYGWNDEVETNNKKKGLMSAVFEFLQTNSHWRTFLHRKNNNGLMVLIRVGDTTIGI